VFYLSAKKEDFDLEDPDVIQIEMEAVPTGLIIDVVNALPASLESLDLGSCAGNELLTQLFAALGETSLARLRELRLQGHFGQGSIAAAAALLQHAPFRLTLQEVSEGRTMHGAKPPSSSTALALACDLSSLTSASRAGTPAMMKTLWST
jgi:hypothetical protein